MFWVFFTPQLSQPAVSIDGQVSNPPSTSSTEVNSQQTAAEQQQPPLQEVKMEIKTDEGEPEQTELQMEEKSEVSLLVCCWGEYLLLLAPWSPCKLVLLDFSEGVGCYLLLWLCHLPYLFLKKGLCFVVK